MSLLALLVPLISSSLDTNAIQGPSGLVLVEGRKVEGVTTRGKPWKPGGAFIEAAGPGNSLECALEVGPGDFTIQARLTLIDGARSGASFALGRGKFVLAGAHEGSPFVVRGPTFHGGKNKVTVLTGTEDMIRDRKTFEFTVRRGGGRIAFSIGSQQVYSAVIGQEYVGKCGFAPGSATMRIHSWSIRANLRTKKRKTDTDILKLQPRIDNAIDTGVQWLLQAQNRDGTWSYVETEYRSGQTALATYTLLKAGLLPTHPAVARALTFLESVRPTKTYSAACQMMAFSATGDPRYRSKLRKLLKDLLEWQKRDGLFGYPRNRPDLSNTQYAALGMRAAHLAGLKVPAQAWLDLMNATLRFQEPEQMLRPVLPVRSKKGTYAMPAKVATAGFCYTPNGKKPTGSMTTAGISVLSFCQQALGKRYGKQRAKAQWAIEKGMRWMARNFSVGGNPSGGRAWHYYYLYGLERVGAALGVEYVGDHRWYYEGARVLVDRQAGDGSWKQRNQEPDTCFAILFLKRATALRTTVTGGARRMREDVHAAVDPSFDVCMRGSGSQHLAVWLDSFSKDVLARHAKTGLRVQRVEYRVDDKVIATVQGAPLEKWSGAKFPTKHSFRRRGKYRVTASVYVVSPNAPKDAVSPLEQLECPGFLVDVKRLLVGVSNEPVRPNRLAALKKKQLKAVASSAMRGSDARFAVDGIQSTRWLCKPKDARPVLTLTVDKGIAANTLVLRQAATRSLDIGVYDRVVRVQIVVNEKDKERTTVELNPNELEPTVIRLRRERKIKHLEIVLLKRSAGQRRGVAGFAEVSLEKRKK